MKINKKLVINYYFCKNNPNVKLTKVDYYDKKRSKTKSIHRTLQEENF